MTAFAIHLGRERIVIAADTAIYVPAKPPAPQRVVGFTTKVHPIPHLRAAIFGRGISQLIVDTAGLALLSPQLDTLERLSDAMPDLLRHASARYCRAAGIDDDAFVLAEVFLVGWSAADRRMRLFFWSHLNSWQRFSDDGTARHILMIPPLPDDEMPSRRGSLDAHLVALMKAERRFFEARPESGVVVGGEVQEWSISRTGISQRVIHRFPDFGQCDIELVARIATGVERVDMTERLFTAAELRENHPRPWAGGLGMYALQIADASLRKSGLLPDPPRPEDDLADIPVVKAFVVRYPSASARSIQDFYDAYDRGKMFFDTWQARAKEGDIEAMGRIQEAGGLSMFLRLDSMHKTLGSQAQFVRDIWKNPTMPPKEKRQFIDDAYRGMLAVATTGTNLLRDVQAMPAPEPPATPPPAPPDGAQWAAQKRQQLKAGGFSDQEIADYLARAPRTLAATP